MGRRSQHKPDELRELILTAARRVVVEEGYQDLSAREIARVIGYAPGTLYNMFKNLDEILCLVETRILGELDQAIADAMAGSSGVEAIRQFAAAYVKFAYSNPRLWELVQEHHPSNRASGPDAYLEQLYAPVARLETVIGKAMPHVDAEEATRLARLIWTAVHGTLNVSITPKYGPLPMPTTLSMADALVVSFMAGLAGPRSGRRDDSRRLLDQESRRGRPAG